MSVIKSNLLLLLAAAIWGFAFVAQRVGMEHVGPFTFNGVRFLLGSLSLIPLIFYFRDETQSPRMGVKNAALPGLLAGTVLFIGASLQQIGLVYTTAGKAAFVTCLYIVLVPVIGIFLRQSVDRGTWLGCMLAVVGLYFLCIKESSAIQFGDMLELIGALFWSFHILIIGHFSRKVDVLKLSCFQFLTCSILSLIVATITETIVINNLLAAAVPILYGGFCSVGIAYTLQVVGQKHAPPAHAAIILSMETVFAVIGGFLLLGEKLVGQEIIGCALMLSGMLVSQLHNLRASKDEMVGF
ncbi:MAG TPA: DMT family transporter [Syntrophomonadaceae bacterium]|nr:DMT family transporter [Syntrophomonadaceae bacterium]